MCYRLKNFFRRWRNKILATSFITVATILYLSYYLFMEINMNWSLFRSDPNYIWNFIFYGIVYGIILSGNIKNSNTAYTGILMFVFALVLDNVIGAIETLLSLNIYSLFSFIFIVASAVFGILYYRNISNYIGYRSNDFKKCRVYGIVFASLIAAGILPLILLAIFMSSESLLIGISLSISEVFCAVSCIFTVERIKR